MKVLIFAAALSLSGAALAQDAQQGTENYPVCSRTVTDKCVNPSQSGEGGRHYGAARGKGWHKENGTHRRGHHKATHRKTAHKTTTTTTTTSTPANPQ